MTLILMAALTLVAVFWLSRPWWRADLPESSRRRRANVDAYHQRLSEIEADVTAGLLAPEAAQAMRDELGARLVADAADLPSTDPGAAVTDRPHRRRNGLITAAVALLFLAAFAGFGYWHGQSWRVDQLIAMAKTDPDGARRQSMTNAVAELSQKLQTDPDNLDGWTLLGHSLFALGRYSEAATALGRAVSLSDSKDPDLLTDQGEALAMAGRSLVGEPRKRFESALQIAPAHPKALWYAGLAAAQAGDTATAIRHWRMLAASPDLPPKLKQALEQRLTELGAAGGEPGTAVADGSGTAKLANATQSAQSVTLNVSLSADLKAKVPAGATLFVYAKANNGPPMPLAIYKGLASELPAKVVLDDSMAMMPAMKLSAFDQWTLTARISASGAAQPRAGDLQGSIERGISDGPGPFDLVIDSVVP